MYYDYDYDERPLRLAEYMLEHRATVREAAAVFGISKSTVHKDIAYRLKNGNRALYDEVRVLLDSNRNERHIRGGRATKLKYLALKNKKQADNKNCIKKIN